MSRGYTVISNRGDLQHWTKSYSEAVTLAQRWRKNGVLGVYIEDGSRRVVFKARDVSGRGGRRCSAGTRVQSLLLARTHFPTEARAISWAKKHGYRAYKIDVKPNTYRLRQANPDTFKSGSLRTITLRPGVKAIVGCPR